MLKLTVMDSKNYRRLEACGHYRNGDYYTAVYLSPVDAILAHGAMEAKAWHDYQEAVDVEAFNRRIAK